VSLFLASRSKEREKRKQEKVLPCNPEFVMDSMVTARKRKKRKGGGRRREKREELPILRDGCHL